MSSVRMHIGSGQKGSSFLMYLLILGVALGIGYATAHEVMVGIGVVGAVIGAVLVVACMADPYTGLVINLFYSFTAWHMSRWLTHDTFPVGVFSDILIVSMFLGYLVRRVSLKATFQSFSRSAAVVCFWIFLVYSIMQICNVNAHSVVGWFLGLRKMISITIIFFVSYDVFRDKNKIRRFIQVAFIGLVMLGVYGCIQQAVGLFPFEREWIMEDEMRLALTYINGEFRKFSLVSGPTEFGMVMACGSVFFLILSMREKGWKAWRYRLGIVPMLMGMAFSGTRTANVMVVAGLGMFILLTFNRKGSRVLAVVAGAVMLFLLYVPIYSNGTLNRFRTSFQGTHDASYQVREDNRHYIQPYIWSHPIGGGLCTTGAIGSIYNPGHYLAGFPTDDDYLQKALEMGWIGLALFCLLYYLCLRTGIRAYFRTVSPEDKMLAAACTCFIFPYYVASYTQIALGSLVDIVLYYPFIAILIRMNEPEWTSS